MFVPAAIPECICFLCVQQQERYVPKATAFLVGVPADLGDQQEASHVYLVTAKHCVERAKRYGPLFVRMNTKTGSIRYEEIKGQWIYGEDEGSDIAVLPFNPVEETEAKTIPLWMMATDDLLQEKNVGIGDDVVVTGLFARRSGTTRNIPIIRSGIISAMPGEPLTGPSGEPYQAYLIEMRSTGGLSGSPVFVVKDWFVDPKNKTANLGLQRFSNVFLLIGVIRGHWEQENIGDVAEDGQQDAEPFNLGIATATPIQECIRILKGEELVKQRRKADLEWRKKNAPVDD